MPRFRPSDRVGAWAVASLTAAAAPFALPVFAPPAAAAELVTIQVTSVSPLSGPSGVTTDVVCGLAAGGEPVPAGTVDLRVDGSVVARSNVAQSDTGAAEVSVRTNGIPLGEHALDCLFAPSAGGAEIVSSAVTVTRDALPQVSADPFGTPGLLSISTPYGAGRPLDVGELLLDPSATSYTAAAPIEGIVVTDARLSRPGFDAYVSARAFEGPSGGFGAEHAGLLDVRAVQVPESPLAAGDVETADCPPGRPGLAQAHLFARYPEGLPGGSVLFIGRLVLQGLPTSLQPGSYTSTVTFTVV